MRRLTHFHCAHGRAIARRSRARASHRHGHCAGARWRVIYRRYRHGSARWRGRVTGAVVHGLYGGGALWGLHRRMASRVDAWRSRMLALCARMPGRGLLGVRLGLFCLWMRAAGHAGHVHRHRLRKNRAGGSNERGGEETIEQVRSPLDAETAVGGDPQRHANHEQMFPKRDEAQQNVVRSVTHADFNSRVDAPPSTPIRHGAPGVTMVGNGLLKYCGE